MSAEWEWLDRRIVEAIHQAQLRRHGGAHGLRDEALLESALARPLNMAAYGEPTVFELAACYAHGLSRNHPFIDGNKRTSFVASVLFLQRAGQRFTGDEAEAAVVFLSLAAGEFLEPDLAEWFRRNCSPPEEAYLVPDQDG